MASVTEVESPDDENRQPVCIGSVEEVRRQLRLVVDVHGREVVLFAIRDTFYALDRKCYHTGGPLQLGDIEEINGHVCVTCPWHRYKISLQTGEGMYQSVDPHNPSKPPEWTSKGVKQRTHDVTVTNGNVYVTLSDLSNKVESDYHYSDAHKQLVWHVPAKTS